MTPSKAKILLVEDEAALVAGLVYALQADGYETAHAADGESALTQLRKESFDLILLDVMIPKRSGLDVLKVIRKEGRSIPVILLTALGQEADKVRGLDLGADDYLTKPFGLAELLARIRVRLRKRGKDLPDVPLLLEFGEVRIDLRGLRVSRKDGEESLTVKEADILKILWAERGQPVSRQRFLDEVWRLDGFPTTRTVDQTIARLRQKIEADPGSPRHLLTVHGIGYRLDA